jgi:hypothetical protein
METQILKKDPQIINLINRISQKDLNSKTKLANIPLNLEIKEREKPEVENFPAIGAVLGGIIGGFGTASVAGIGVWGITAGVLSGITMGLAAGQILGSLMNPVSSNWSPNIDTSFIQSKKSSPTFGFDSGAGTSVALRGEVIPIVYCNYEDNKWGGVKYQGKIVSTYITNKNNIGEAYIITIISSGEVEEIRKDKIYIGTQSKDSFYKDEITVYYKLNDNQNIAEEDINPDDYRRASQVIFPESYKNLGADYITETTNYDQNYRKIVEIDNGQWGSVGYENSILRFTRGRIYTSEADDQSYWQEWRITQTDDNSNLIYVSRLLTGFLWNGSEPNDKNLPPHLSSQAQNNEDYEEITDMDQCIVSGRIFEIWKAYYKTSNLVNEIRFNFNVLLYKTKLDEYKEEVQI